VEGLTRLALAAGRGDTGALDALVEGTYPQVWRFCAGLVDPQSADDLAQETFIRAVRALPGFGGDASARTWLLAVARHTCLDELRARDRRRRRDRSLRELAAQDRPVVDAAEAQAFTDLVARLDPERRAAFVLTQLLGLSYLEAASVSGCPVGTIRSRVARARAELVEQAGSPAERQEGARRERPSA
jgi:RNA polymerase sigma-70 factor, ECF subfamily